MKRVCLLGATGSIGDSTISVLKQHPDRFQLHSIAARDNWKKIAGLAREFNIKRICMFSETAAKELSKELGFPVLAGMDGLLELATEGDVDIVVNAFTKQKHILWHIAKLGAILLQVV